MIVKVTAKHIKTAQTLYETRTLGRVQRMKNCPVALALKDAGLPTSLWISRENVWFRGRAFALPVRVTALIDRMDNDSTYHPKPFVFVVPNP